MKIKESLLVLALLLSPHYTSAQPVEPSDRFNTMLCSQALEYDSSAFNLLTHTLAERINDRSFKRKALNSQRNGVAQSDFYKACSDNKDKTVEAVARYLMEPDTITKSGSWTFSKQLMVAVTPTNIDDVTIAVSAISAIVEIRGFKESCFDAGVKPDQQFEATVNDETYTFYSSCLGGKVGTLKSKSYMDYPFRVENIVAENVRINLPFSNDPIEFNGATLKPLCTKTSLYCPSEMLNLQPKNQVGSSELKEVIKLREESESKLEDIFNNVTN